MEGVLMQGRALSFDERKAAEAAFQGESPDPEWSEAAFVIYGGILEALADRALRQQGSMPAPEVVATPGR
jgi:hypothetical protein